MTLRDPTLGPLRASVDINAEPPANPDITVEVRVPMTRVDGVTIGSITIGNLRDDERNMIDRPSLNRVAERAAAVITGLAEYQRQRRTALRLQEAMLPGSTQRLTASRSPVAISPATSASTSAAIGST